MSRRRRHKWDVWRKGAVEGLWWSTSVYCTDGDRRKRVCDIAFVRNNYCVSTPPQAKQELPRLPAEPPGWVLPEPFRRPTDHPMEALAAAIEALAETRLPDDPGFSAKCERCGSVIPPTPWERMDKVVGELYEHNVQSIELRNLAAIVRR